MPGHRGVRGDTARAGRSARTGNAHRTGTAGAAGTWRRSGIRTVPRRRLPAAHAQDPGTGRCAIHSPGRVGNARLAEKCRRRARREYSAAHRFGPRQGTRAAGLRAGLRALPVRRAALREVAPRLAQASEITLSGRTDSTGPAATNDGLAKARAQAVLRQLLALSPAIAPRVSVDAQGACCYAESNDSPAGRANNRRVEIRYRIDGHDPP